MLEIIRPRKGNIVLVGIGIEPEEPFVTYGTTQQLTTRAKPRSASKGNITWSGGSSSVATVDANGLVTGKSSNEATVIVTATSDAGFSDTKLVRCGKDITDIAFPTYALVIDGIQGVSFEITSTPSGVTDISFVVNSERPNIAYYTWNSSALRRRMWGVGLGQGIVTVSGRSGNAQYSTAVTVSLVRTTGIEIRGNYDTEPTEQGDNIPPLLERRIMFVDQEDSYVDVYFFPFNATERDITITNSDDSIADVFEEYPQGDYRNQDYGTLRKKRLKIRSKAVGQTTITVTGVRGLSDSFVVDVREAGSFSYGVSVYADSTNGGRVTVSYGTEHVDMTEFVGWKYDVSTTNARRVTEYSEQNPHDTRAFGYEKSSGSQTATLSSAYVYYINKQGNRVQMSGTSGSASW